MTANDLSNDGNQLLLPFTGRGAVRNGEEKRRQMLERLRRGPLSTFDAERLHHRGQATIGALREEGYRIDLVSVDDRPVYVLKGWSPVVRVTTELKNAYYETDHWRRIAKRRKESDGFRCAQCGVRQELETHHWRYELFAEDLDEDLITLCSEHHQKLHEAAAGSQMHFPRCITQELAERIERNK